MQVIERMNLSASNIIMSVIFTLYAIAMIITGAIYIHMKKINQGYPSKMYVAGGMCIILALINVGLAAGVLFLRS